MLKIHTSYTRDLFPWSVISILLSIIYLPLVFPYYAYADDLPFVSEFASNQFNPWINGFSVQGRPLAGWMLWIFSATVQQIQDLWILRLGGFVALLWFSWLAFRMIRKSNSSTTASVTLTILAICNPATGVIVTWAICYSYLWAAVIAGAAGYFAWRSTHPNAHIVSRILYLLSALILGILAEGINQIFAGAFILAPTWLGWTDDHHSTPNLRLTRWFYCHAIFAVVMFLYFILFKAGIYLFVDQQYWSSLTQRSQLLNDVPKKILYFYEVILQRGISGWFRFLPNRLATVGFIFSASLITAGLLLCLRRLQSWNQRLVLIALYSTSILLSVAPLLIVNDDHSPFRVLFVIFIVLMIPIVDVLNLMHLRRRKMHHVICFFMIAGTIIAAAYTVRFKLVAGKVWELEKLEEGLRFHFSGGYPEWIIVSGYGAGQNPFVANPCDEYGTLPHWYSWGLSESVKLTLLKLYPEEKDNFHKKSVLAVPYIPEGDKGIVQTIHIRDILELGPPWDREQLKEVDHPLLPGLKSAPHTHWYYWSPIGFFHTPHDLDNLPVHIAVPTLGVITLNVLSKDNILIEIPGKNWCWTNEDIYPWLYQFSEQKWIFGKAMADGKVHWF